MWLYIRINSQVVGELCLLIFENLHPIVGYEFPFLVSAQHLFKLMLDKYVGVSMVLPQHFYCIEFKLMLTLEPHIGSILDNFQSEYFIIDTYA